MKRKIFFILLLFSNYNNSAQSPLSKLYNFTIDTIITCANSAQYVEDSFFIAGGQAAIDSGRQGSTYIATFDYNFNLKRKKYLSFAGQNRLWGGNNAITKIGSDKYALVGVCFDDTTNKRILIYQPFIFIFNSNLDSIAYRQFTDTVRSRAPFSIVRDTQGNILLSGESYSNTLHYSTSDHSWYPDSTSAWVAKIDTNANLLWSRQYFGFASTETWAYKIVPGHDAASYVIAGLAYNPSEVQMDNYFAKIDIDGNLVWRKYLLKPYQSWTDIDLISLKSGNYAFVSSYSDAPPISGIPSTSYYYYGKINESGDTLWTRHIGYSFYQDLQGERIAESNTGDLYLLGTTFYNELFPSLIHANSKGEVIAYRDYIYLDTIVVSTEQLGNINITKNNQILMSGVISNNYKVPGYFDTVGSLSWFVLTDSFGCVTGGCQTGDTVWHTAVTSLQSLSEVSVYPNPFSDQVTISSPNPIAQQNTIAATLTDVFGREVYDSPITQQKQTLNLPNLPPGMYYLTLTEEGYKKTFKLVRQ